MKTIFLALSSLFLSILVHAQEPWKTTLCDSAENIHLHIDLYKESINVPDMEMFGPMHGYMNGNIYGTWTITSCTVKDDRHATLRLSNDLGSETQAATLNIESDGTYTLQLGGTTCIKRVVGRKLVKISSTLHFRPTGG